MSKMLWELKAPLAVAQAKENMGLGDIYKYLRYYRMYMSRFSWEVDGVDLTRRIENLLFWRGKCAIYNDSVLGVVVCEITSEKVDANGTITEVNLSAENGYKRFNKEVGKEVVILYADETTFAPVLYIWAIANKIIEREDIIDSQDNMLRKPIMVKGEGEDFDNACAKMQNILSGVAWFNTKTKGKSTALSNEEVEVLNLQVGNAYKGKELWESRSKYEELIKDYLGYMSVNNDKKERMITDEVNESNAVCETFYNSAVTYRELGVKQSKEIGITIKLTKNLEIKKEEKENDNKEKVESTFDRE